MQHAQLTPERWARFGVDQQVLMIACELQRGSDWLARGDRELLQNCYERALRLTDLTIQTQTRRPFRRELLRWRDLVAQLYTEPRPDPTSHREALRALLLFTPEAARQIPYAIGPES